MIKLKKITLFIFCLVLINILAKKKQYRWDMTKDQRYSVSEIAKDLIKKGGKKIDISIYLGGNLPYNFEKFKHEISYFLKELKSIHSNIRFKFLNPNGKENSLIKQGLIPSQLMIQEEDKISNLIIFPWAIIESDGKKKSVNLLKNNYFKTADEQIENSIANLEFAFLDVIQSLIKEKKQKIAILKGNGQLDDLYQYDFLKTLGNHYFLAPFTLDSVGKNPSQTLGHLQKFDLAVIAKPNKAFSEKEKFTLDQYTMNGGKILWLLDLVNTPKDSLIQNGKILAYQQNLNLTDYLFNYGVRIKKHLIKDLYAAKLSIAIGKMGTNTQFNQFFWNFYPIVNPNERHAITRSINPVKLEFANSIDTLNPTIKKTSLLESSKFTKIVNIPSYIKLSSITENIDPKTYNSGSKILGILLEGDFKSAYRNRLKPFKNDFKTEGKNNKMIVIADGDISTNQIDKGIPLELGFDKWTNSFFGNKEFLINAVNYLLNEDGLIQLRNKKVTINTLDKPKAHREKTQWLAINILTPLILLGLFGFSKALLKRKMYT